MVYGYGIYDFDDTVKNHYPFYSIWHDMLKRCYCEKYLDRFPSYKGTSVCNEWKYFSNFEKWAIENYKHGYHLDKDIISGDTKLYSPKTCSFVPQIINQCIKSCKSNTIYPIGVSYYKNDGYNELSKPYSSTISKYGKSLRKYYATPEEAHQAWQKEKILYLNELIELYKTSISDEVIRGLQRRIQILQYDIDNSLITENVNKV